MNERMGKVAMLPRSVGLLLAVFACVGMAGAQEEALVEYSADENTVVLSLSQIPGELAEPDATPRLRVYGDGRVVVHYPTYMTKAGDYTSKLTGGELDSLLSSMTEKNVADFDVAAAKEECVQAASAARRASPRVVQYRSSDMTTIIEINLVTYRAAGSTEVQKNFSKRIVWHGLQTDAKEHPEVESVSDLAAAETELLALCDRVTN